MAKLLFIILFLAEIALLVFTLTKQKSKKEWVRNRFIVNGFELLIFISMTLLPGIDFGFRFIALLLVLALRILISGIRFLIKYRKAEGDRKKAGLIISTLVMVILVFLSMVPAFVIRDYNGKETSGSYQVGMKHVILVDQSREETFENDGSKREVPIYIYYPKNAGSGETYPLILFSHGAFGYYQSNTSTYMELASNGYVVISMEHPYHALFTTDTDGNTIISDQTFLMDAMNIGNSNELTAEKFAVTSTWMELRKADMNFVLDTVEKACKEQTIPQNIWYLRSAEKEAAPTEEEILGILEHINCDKIGLMGHSLGGATATAIGHEREDISAVIDLDGTMLGEEMGYVNDNYVINEKPYPIPLLSVDNEGHFQDGIEQGSYYVNNVIIENAVNGQHCYIKGAEHMNFTDLPLFSPTLAAMFGVGTIDADHCIEIVNEVVLNYMNSNLKGDGSYRVEEFYE